VSLNAGFSVHPSAGVVMGGSHSNRRRLLGHITRSHVSDGATQARQYMSWV